MKNSFSTFELILTIIISSIIMIYSLVFIKELFGTNKDIQQTEIYKIDLLATKAFLQKQKEINKKLKLQDETLFFEENILLEKVKEFNLQKTAKYIQIDINLDNQISQTWKFKL